MIAPVDDPRAKALRPYAVLALVGYVAGRTFDIPIEASVGLMILGLAAVGGVWLVERRRAQEVDQA